MEFFLMKHQLSMFNAVLQLLTLNSVVANAYLITGPSLLDRWRLYFLHASSCFYS
jgi:hypothetical protein